jgi:hypothetical protein
MNEMSRFCTNCGAPLRSGVRFCGGCGAPVLPVPPAPVAQTPPAYQAPIAPPAQPAPAYQAPVPQPALAYQAPAAPAVAAYYPPPVAEPILAMVLGLQRRKGLMGVDSMNLVVTPARLIFAMVTKQMMKEAVVTARNEAKGRGKGFLGQVAAQMGWQSVIARQYGTMPVDAILTQYPGSFAVPNAQVTKIHFHESSMDDDGGSYPARMLIHTTGSKLEFSLAGTGMSDARQALRQVLPHAVR